ncbi:hypothetical protein QUF54_09170, partial [Candidatus Marithioploca araucensis]|nr:hypothetical protein [Candidatus Marithioploca araucensis]
MSIQYKRTNWVRRLEDFSSACSSGFRLGQWLIAGILAIFSGISRLLPVTRWLSVILTPDVPVVSTTGASSLKSPASIWRGVVFVALVVGLMMVGHVAFATVTFDAEIQVTGRKLTYPTDSKEYTFQIPYFYVKNKRKKVCKSASNSICLPSPDCKLDLNKTHVDSSEFTRSHALAWECSDDAPASRFTYTGRWRVQN